jgi:transcriptional regulator with XRE-family HTH domain
MTPNQIEAVARDLVHAVRGAQTQSAFSRRIGYKSNIVHRWESGKCWPTASTFLSVCLRGRPALANIFEQFFKRQPAWFDARAPFSRESIAAFLRDLRGRAPVATLAERTGYNRYSVGRWLRGSAEPKLPEFLALVDAASRRLLDLLALIADPSRMPTISKRWRELEQARALAYDSPWSHAVLRALELEGYRRTARHGERWLANRLGISVAQVGAGLERLATTNQIRKQRGKWRAGRVIVVDTSQDAARSRELKAAWASVALERLRAGAPGNYGFSLFAASRKDIRRLRDLHLEYVRAMQNLIAESTPGECVGLYCAQLLDLSAVENALG